MSVLFKDYILKNIEYISVNYLYKSSATIC